jgi:hypothetical protein
MRISAALLAILQSFVGLDRIHAHPAQEEKR